MAKRRTNGEGTVFRRKDGRYVAAVTLLTVGGARKRIVKYGKTAQEAHTKLVAAQAQVQQGVPLPDRDRKLGDYLEYWLEHFVKSGKRPKTYQLYEMTIRLYLRPGLGSQALTALSVPMVQGFLNQLLDQGRSVRMVQAVRTTLSAALTRAQREELITRNVARLVELPEYVRKDIQPWSLIEAKQFLTAATEDRLFAAFVLLLFYGLRRGEVLGLRWCDIDQARGVIHVRSQLQRVEHKLVLVPVKTKAGQRDLPLVSKIGMVLEGYRLRQSALRDQRPKWAGSGDEQELIFTTNVGTPIEPRNFVRSFWNICNAHGVRVIKLHHVRHTTATLLKDLGVPARDAQFILGHASSWMTEQIYQHDSMASRMIAIEKVEDVFARALDAEADRCYQDCYQFEDKVTILPFMEAHPIYKFGGPGGTRTLDTLLKRQPRSVILARLQSVRAEMEARTRALLIAGFAINVAINPETVMSGDVLTLLPSDGVGQSRSVSIGRTGLAACGLTMDGSKHRER